VITGKPGLSIPTDESTLSRWRHWFNNLADYFQGCLQAIKIRYGYESVKDASLLPSPSSTEFGIMLEMPRDGWQELSDRWQI